MRPGACSTAAPRAHHGSARATVGLKFGAGLEQNSTPPAIQSDSPVNRRAGELRAASKPNVNDPQRSPSHDRRRTDSADLASLKREIALRDDILSLAAHELRNPLHALALHLALARATAQGGNATDAAERIRRAELTLKRYAERVTVLMELLASPGAQFPLARRPVDVPALVATLAESLEQEARSRGIDMAVEAAGFGAERRIDAVAFEQVLDNLLLNAFKHSGASRVVIRLVADADSWRLEVEDNGRGIALEDQQTIFGKFAVAAHSSRGAGTGLGLWIVTRLVQAMGGEITLSSEPGTGSVFTVRIPEADETRSKR